MRSTHPVNFAVAVGSDQIQKDLQQVNTGNITDTKAGGKVFPLFKSARSATQTLECSSCHSVHDNSNAPFLRETMAGSALCLGCHAK
jgi:predicted CXXCH cytochrome family protein